jgi:chaperonin GroEL
MIGAKVFSEKKGSRLENAEIADLGRADKFISRQKESVIVGPKGKKEVITKAIADLRIAHDNATDEPVKKDLERRIATYSNKIAVIKVGAATENEERALRYKVEDAVNAVQAAFKGGVVCGAGLGLSRLVTSSEILNEALKAPFKQLKLNMGITTHRELKSDEAINAVSGKIGKYMEVGVIDPVQVLIAGIESAVSIASILITSKGMIVEVLPQPKTE